MKRSEMFPVKAILLTYLYSFFCVSIAAWLGINVQQLFRIPLINVRWIDLAIITNVFAGILSFLSVAFGNTKPSGRKISLLQFLILCYLFVEALQLVRSYGATDPPAQISLFAATLSLFIVLHLSCIDVTEKVHRTLLWFSVVGALVLTATVALQMIGLVSGFAYVGEWGRVEFGVLGKKEVVSNSVLIPLVLVHAIIAPRLRIGVVRKAIYVVSVAALLIFVILSVHRGLLFTLFVTLMVFGLQVRSGSVFSRSKTIAAVAAIFVVTLFVFGDELTALGYNPMEKLLGTYEYATDVETDNWDKGRALVQAFALDVWLNHLWFGVGYDVLDSYGMSMSPHNVVITSLFHRGIVGTVLLLGILTVGYGKSIRLWRLSRVLPERERLLNQALVFATLLWLIPLITQEAMWEKYSLSVQYVYLGLVVGLERFYTNRLILRVA